MCGVLEGDNGQVSLTLLWAPLYPSYMYLPPSLPLPHPPSLQGSVFLLDCRPVLSFSSCHISGAANINLASMMKKRFMAGKIGLVDLISSAEAKEQLKVGLPQSFPHSYITFLHVVYIYM